ncbi:MAG: Trk system potassium transporter TrkA [Bacteroidales bacterium]|nr:Trk system potassium transporter TrkA [Clostridium sp.]MCM1203729.1 Trk system potassium transporter TrkA [Bacteroidales bacterium]
MRIIIAGCGKVGYALAEQLNEEGHDITMIDTDGDKLNTVLSLLDVQGVEGNATTFRIQLEAGIKDSDLLIAVTGQDEVNLLCCLIAKKAGNCHTIARVRNPEYFSEIKYLRKELGLSLAINPELACAQNIARLIEVPSALDITSFAKGKINLIKFFIPNDSVIHSMTVSEFANKIHANTLICAIEREHEVIIPDGNTVLQQGDNMYVIIPPADIHTLLSKIGIKAKPIKSVMIIGGGTISYYLAKHLESTRVQVKIVEQRIDRCEQLSDLLPHAMIINGDATDRQLLLEEGIDETEAFVALTDIDEENLVLALFANKVNQAKIVTKVDKVSFEEVVDELPIGTIACPKNITAKSIIQYVRALQNSFGSNIETLYRMLDDKVEALEFSIKQESKVTGTPLMELDLKKNLLVCAIVRNGKVITPSGKDTILNGDTVIVVTTNKGLTDIKDILA